jgi:hypothetical protein
LADFTENDTALLREIAHSYKLPGYSEELRKRGAELLERVASHLDQLRAAGVAPSHEPSKEAVLIEALQFYAQGSHFARHDPDVWDTVSGEPPNFYEDENHTATVEDGSVAKMALAAAGVTGTQEPNGTLLSWARELLEAMDEFPTGSDASGHANTQAVGRIAKAKVRIRELIEAADGVMECRPDLTHCARCNNNNDQCPPAAGVMASDGSKPE